MSPTHSIPLTVWLAGSTHHTVLSIQGLLGNKNFRLAGVLTPKPKLVDRSQQTVTNPVHQFGLDQPLPIILVDQKLDTTVKTQVDQLVAKSGPPDFLLVVDFGYLVPDWLLSLPKVAPINVHPSLLPRWRGASPGQMVILSGETESGVSLMRVETGLDTGAIYRQIKFEVDPHWTSTEYYQQSFQLAEQFLPQVLTDITQGLPPKPQPSLSPTPEARQLSRQDGFIAWPGLYSLMTGQVPTVAQLPALWRLTDLNNLTDHLNLLDRAVRALQPWPGVWTLVPTHQGDKRLKILAVAVKTDRLILSRVQFAGQQPASWNQVKNNVVGLS